MTKENFYSKFERNLSRFSKYVGKNLNSIRKGIEARQAERQRLSEIEARSLEDARKELEIARHRFAELYWKVYEKYEPDDRAALADISRLRFSQIIPLIEAEMYRIAAILEPIFREAGFQLGHENQLIRLEMNAIWDEAQGNLQKRVFAGIRFPIGLVWRGNQLAIEQQAWKQHGHNGPGYYGILSNRYYGQKVVVLAP